MQLIGMLDSPYVRRVAVSLQCLGLPFEHRSISVFREVDLFRSINPVVKAPSLVCDDGAVLMDSTLILDYAEALAGQGRSLVPRGLVERRDALRSIGLALAACEKCVQIVYERSLRPPEKRHEPWVARITGQLLAACDALEADLDRRRPPATSASIDQAGITAAVVWTFIVEAGPDGLATAHYPLLNAHSARAEVLDEFRAAPHGDGTCRAG